MSGQSRFLEAPLVRQADGELKNLSLWEKLNCSMVFFWNFRCGLLKSLRTNFEMFSFLKTDLNLKNIRQTSVQQIVPKF